MWLAVLGRHTTMETRHRDLWPKATHWLAYQVCCASWKQSLHQMAAVITSLGVSLSELCLRIGVD